MGDEKGGPQPARVWSYIHSYEGKMKVCIALTINKSADASALIELSMFSSVSPKQVR